MAFSVTLCVPTTDDEPVRRLVLAGLRTAGFLAPRRDRVTAARGLAFTAAVRVVDRVHGDAANVRAPALVTLRPALPRTSFMLSGFDTAPIVAMQTSGTMRTSPEASFSCA